MSQYIVVNDKGEAVMVMASNADEAMAKANAAADQDVCYGYACSQFAMS